MAELSGAELQNLVVSQQRELDAMRRATEAAAVRGAVSQAVAGFQFASEAAAQQAVGLLAGKMAVHRDGDKLHVHGPEFEPAFDFVKTELSKPEYRHFLRGGGATPDARGGQTTVGVAAEQQPGESLGAFLVRRATEQRTSASGNPSQDMSQAFGLRARR
jgi:hypothetical protein